MTDEKHLTGGACDVGPAAEFAAELEARFSELVELMRRYPVEVEWKGPPYFRYVFDCEADISKAIAELRSTAAAPTRNASVKNESPGGA